MSVKNLLRCEGVSFVSKRNVGSVDETVLYSSNLQPCSNLSGVVGCMLYCIARGD